MKGEKRRVVISTFFEGFAIKHIIPKLSPDKIIIALDDLKSSEEKKEKMKETLKSLKDFFKDAIEIETFRISSYDIPKIMMEINNKIEEESKKGSEILIHITEGRKTTSLAVLFSAYLKKDLIEGAYYITEEDKELIKLPLLKFEISGTKKKMLSLINKGVTDINKIMSELNIKQSATYKNINELKAEGYLKKEDSLILTDLGKIMVV